MQGFRNMNIQRISCATTERRFHMNHKKFEELELKDDFMFGKVMSQKNLCKQTLEILLGITIDDIQYSDTQKSIDITYESKSVQLDFYVQDNTGTVYDAEMQQQSNKKTEIMLPKRSRYYQGMIDLNLIEKGVPYSALNQSFIIFICTFDPFGQGLYQYTFQNMCLENTNIFLGDGTTKIFFNTKGNLKDAPESLRKLLHYIETKEAEDDFTKTIDLEVEHIKSNETWRREYMKEILHDLDMKELGKEEGEHRFALLTEKLLKANRSDDLLKATSDIVFRQSLYEEFSL